MVTPWALATPQQREEIMKMQVFTRHIQYIIHTDDGANRIEITLKTNNPQAAQFLPQIRENLVTTTAQMFYDLFAMAGKRV